MTQLVTISEDKMSHCGIQVVKSCVSLSSVRDRFVILIPLKTSHKFDGF